MFILMALENVVGQASFQANLEQFLLVLSVSLGVATCSRLFVHFREIPYTILLVIVGLILALLDVRLIEIPPEVTLFIFLPPLLFRTAWGLDWSVLKRDAIALFLCAGVGVVLTIALLGFCLSEFTHLSPIIALLTGASLAATSPVSIVTLFSSLGVDRRLAMLVEGENLFNSAIAIGCFILILDFPVDLELEAIDWSLVIGNIAALGGIGLAIGGILGLGVAYLIQLSDFKFLGRSLLLVSAYGTYLLAEELGGSGVVATIVAGSMLGTFGVQRIAPYKRQILTEFLGFVAFLVNSIVFLLIGDRINFANLGDNILPIGITIAAVLLARAVAIYGVCALTNEGLDSQINWREQTLMCWTGLRGSVSIALALSLPMVLGQRQAIEATVFGVVLFTLLVQGLTTKPLLQRLGFLQDRSLQQQYLQAIARSVALSEVLKHLQKSEIVERWGNDPKFARYCQNVKREIERIQAEIDNTEQQNPQLQAIASQQLEGELMTMENEIYATFVQAGLLKTPPPAILPAVLRHEDKEEITAGNPVAEQVYNS